MEAVLTFQMSASGAPCSGDVVGTSINVWAYSENNQVYVLGGLDLTCANFVLRVCHKSWLQYCTLTAQASSMLFLLGQMFMVWISI